jgi:subtilase family serine protease
LFISGNKLRETVIMSPHAAFRLENRCTLGDHGNALGEGLDDGSRRAQRRRGASRRRRRASFFPRIEQLEERLLLAVEAFPTPLQPVQPFGSLIHQGTLTADFTAVSETDSYTIALDGGQRLTVLLSPRDGSIAGQIEVLGPDSEPLGGAMAAAAGDAVALQNLLLAASGAYQINLTNLEGTGEYGLTLLLNAGFEQESLNAAAGGSNDGHAQAEDLTLSTVVLAGGADRLAVLGELAEGDVDMFQFSLSAGQHASLLMSSENGGGLLALLDGDGLELARGVAGASNHDQAIAEFRSELGGVYHARVSGGALQSPEAYRLVVTRDASFEREPNDRAETAQDISATGLALGALRSGAGGVGASRSIHVAILADTPADVAVQLNDDTYFDFTAVAVGSADVDTVEELMAYDVVILGTTFNAISAPAAAAIRAWNEAGLGGVVGMGYLNYNLNHSGAFYTAQARADIDAVVPLVLQGSSTFTSQATIIDPTHPVTQGVANFSYSAGDGNLNGADAGGTVLATNGANGTPTVVVREVGRQRNVWLGPSYGYHAGTSLRFGDPDRLLEQAVAWSAGSLDRVDFYSFQANGDDVLTIATTTPGDGPGQPANELDPILELYGPGGSLVASNSDGAPDGKNALINYQVPSEAGGTYTVRLAPVSGEGDYTLGISGATSTDAPPLLVTASSLADGSDHKDFPGIIQLEFSAAVLLPTVQASDLTVNGLPASSVAIVDGRTLIFDVADLEDEDGTYEVNMAAGAIESLRGTGNEAFTLTFQLDTTAPVVTETNVETGDVLLPGSQQFLFTFSEELATDFLGPEDVVLVENFSGRTFPVDGLFSYDPGTNLLVVEYLGLEEGAYSLTLLSGTEAFRDLVGNPLNGAPSFPLPSGQGDPAGDDFVLHFSVDTDSVDYPVPLGARRPLGSLVYQGAWVASAFHEAGDVDSFTLELAGGQTVTLGLRPVDEAVHAALALFDPLGNSLAAVAAAEAGQAVIAQTVAIVEAGVYRIDATSQAGAGRYELQVILNAAAEEESLLGGSNDTRALAQNLDGSSVALQAGADRLAVVGQVGSGYEIASIDTIPLSGGSLDELSEIRALTQVGTDAFRLASGNSLFTLTSGGDVSLRGSMDHWSKGLAYVNDVLYSIDAFDSWLHQIDPDTGETISSVAITLPGRVVFGGNGLAVDPTTGQIWALLQLSGQFGRELVMLDPVTGDASSIGDTGDRFAGLAFDDAGALYGITGIGGATPETLYSLDKQDAGRTFLVSVAGGVGGQALAWLTADGRFYQATGTWQGNARFQSLLVTRHEDSTDVYSFSLMADQAVTLAVATQHGGFVELELLADDGTVLARGIRDAGNVQAHIPDFVASAAGTYYARVSAEQFTSHGLTVVRGATFNLTTPAIVEAGQFIGVTGQVLGSLGAGGHDEVTSISLPINLFDGDGFRWDIQRDGNINDGSNDAYDGGLFHNGFPTFTSGLAEDDGREVVIGPATVSGLQVTRKIHVPTDQGYARFLEIVTNPSESAVNYTVSIRSNLGSDGSTIVVGTSGGDLIFTEADDWVVTDDSVDGGGDPTLLHVIAGAGGQRPVLASRSGDNLRYDYELTLAPGETKIVLHFASQNINRATALAKAPDLTALQLDALEGLSNAERAAIVNFAVPLLEHSYLVEVNEGDQLTVTTATPGGGPGEPVNELDPMIELFDPDGNLVAEDDNSGDDGRNAWLTHTALAAGTYRVVVRNSGNAIGDFTLWVDGATGTRPFEVATTDPDEGVQLSEFPATYLVRLNQAVLLPSIQAGDLTINGVPATGVTIVDPYTIEFDIAGVAAGDGVYSVVMQVGVLTSLSGQPLAEFSSTFFIDTEPPTVISSSVGEGDVLAVGAVTYVAQFSEPMALDGLGPEDVTLFEHVRGLTFVADTFAYDDADNRVTVFFADLPEGSYTLTLHSGPDAFRDSGGTLLDGSPSFPLPSGDGFPGGDFAVNFVVDAVISEFPIPLEPTLPLGSLIHEGVASGWFHAAGDVDGFTVELDAGQTVTVILQPLDESLRGRLALLGPGDVPLQSADASAAGWPALLQSVAAVTAGTYRIDASSLAESGEYELRLILNAAVEEEGLLDGTNNGIATAQNLDGTFAALGNGAERGAVLGRIDSTDITAATGDYYALELEAGQAATLVLSSLNGALVQLELLDASDLLLSLGLTDAINVASHVRDFVPASTGTYYVRVTAEAASQYSLTITRGATFDIEPNDDLLTAQDITVTGIALGAVGRGVVGDDLSQIEGVAYVRSTSGSPWGSTANETAMNVIFGAGNWDDLRLQTVDPAVLFSNAYSFVFLEGSDGTANALQAFLATNLSQIETFVAAGNTVFINSAPNQGSGMDFGFGGVSLVYPDFTNTATAADTLHSIFQGPMQPITTTFTGSSFSHATVTGDGLTPLLTASSGRTVLAEMSWGRGLVMFGGMTTSNFHSPQPQGNNLRANIIAYVAAAAASDVADYFHVQVQAGDTLTIGTATPGDGAGEFVNLLDPLVELYDPSGELVEMDDNGAADGRNAQLTHQATQSGVYTVRVRAATSDPGEYVLTVTGHTGGPPPLTVTQADPPDGDELNTLPTTYRVSFSQPLLVTSVDADDLRVNGVAADSVTLIAGNALEFVIATAAPGDGLYSVTIAEGALTSISGMPLTAFSATFDVDATSPTVIASSLAPGDIIPTGEFVYQVQFSEPLATEGLEPEDVMLVDDNTGEPAGSPDHFSYDPETSTVTIVYQNLHEGDYTLTLLTSETAFRDLRGNLLDGSPSFPLPSGDGTSGDPFVVSFTVDNVSEAFPTPLQPLAPLGSLIYDPPLAGRFHVVGDVDAYTIQLDAGQTLTLRLTPREASIQGQLELLDPDNVSLALASAATAGQTVLLQTVPIAEAGTYTFMLTSLAGIGAYEIGVVLNGALEEETYGGANNDSPATAQNINASTIALQGGATRLAVLGHLVDADSDFYSFELAAGQPATFVLAPQSAGQTLELALGVQEPDGSMRVLALGVRDRDGNQRVTGFVPETGGEYVARLTGPADGDYALLITRGAEFDEEPNFDPTMAQDISATGQVLGSLGRRHVGDASRVAVVGTGGVSDDSGFVSIVNQLNDQTHFSFQATLVAPWEVDTLAELNAYDVVVIGNTGFANGDGFEQFAPALRGWVEAGGGVVMTGWGIYGAGTGSGTPVHDINAIVPVNTAGSYSWFHAGTLTPIDTMHPVMAGMTAFTLSSNNYIEYPVTSPQVDPGATVLATSGGQPVVVVGNPGAGRGVYLGPIYSGYSGYSTAGLRTGLPDRLLEQAVAWAGSLDREDYFVLQVSAGDSLELMTTTPGGGPGEPHNELDPRLELYNELGFLVASDDNSAADGRNARIVYNVPENSSGQYAARVSGEGGGVYTLLITGAAPQLGPAPFVTESIPAAGQNLAGPPTTVTLTLSEAVRVDSVDASDLQIDGGATVVGVELVDGRTLRFTVEVPEVEGVYTYTLAAGVLSDLQGQGNLEHVGTFAIDQTGPRVVAQVPTAQASAPFTQWTFVFDEPLDPASFTTADVVTFTAPGGASLLGQITGVSVVGAEATVTFNAQTAQGTYTMIIGPDITDAVGNLMDQNQNGIGGETGDRYTAIVDLQSPDLEVQSVLVPGSALFGQNVDVTWTVRNIGSDPASEGWSDRIYLSTNTTLDFGDVLLATVASPQVPLGAGQEYPQTIAVTLPLNVSLDSGEYFILVVTDALNQQPESNEGNNLLASAALPIALPPLPDLVVSSIAAPQEAFSGQVIQISWTLTNQGDADASGTWTDWLFLSTDDQPGGDQFFGSFSFTGTLAAGQSLVRTQNITLPINMQGNRWVVVRTDVFNQIFEHANFNNNTTVSAEPIDVRLSPFPNLQVTAITPPATAFSGQEALVEWVVTNTGNGSTSAPLWYDGVYLSTTPDLDGAVFLGTANNSSYLGPGESYVNSRTVTLPQGISGNFYFIIGTDLHNHVYEFENEHDNVSASDPVTVQLTPPPDLQVGSVVGPLQAFSGQPMTLTWTVVNEGEGNTRASVWHDRVYMSSDNVLDGSDTLLGTFTHSGALAPGASYTTSRTVTPPTGVSGDFFFIVHTDASNHVFEHVFELNNVGGTQQAIPIILTPPPDLVVHSVTSPAVARAGVALTVAYRVANDGATTTPNSSWQDRLYLSTDNVFDPSTDLLIGTRTRFGALAPETFYDDSITGTLPHGLEGEFFVFVHTDAGNVVFELDNANNIGRAAAPITLQYRPADLVVADFQAPASAQAGAAMLVNWTVLNQGLGDTIVSGWSDRIVLAPEVGPGIVLTTVARAALLAPGDSYGVSNLLVQIPSSVAPGEYRLLLTTDIFNQVHEGANEANNTFAPQNITIVRWQDEDGNEVSPDLRVTQVAAPGAVASGQPISVSWTVENAGPITTNATWWYDDVYLSSGTQIADGDLRLGRIQRTNPLVPLEQYTITRTFNLPIDLSGNYYVIVRTNADARVTELDRTNNDRPADAVTAITLSPTPDLAVTSVLAPLEANSGQSFELSWTVSNVGDGATNQSWFDAVYLSLDQVLDRNSDVYLGFRDRPHNLAAGQEYTRTASFTIPRGLSGPFYVFVAADSNDRVYERGSELNNVRFAPLSMQVNLSPPANLVAGVITIPENAIPGQDLSVTYTVHNHGTDPAVGTWTDSLFISADTTWDLSDLLLGRVQLSGPLFGGDSYTRTLTAPLPGVTPGQYHVIVRTDIFNQVPETDLSDNLRASLEQVSIDLEELTLGVPVNGTLAQGQSVFYKVQLTAGETIRLRFDSQSATAANELYIRHGQLPTRGQFDATTEEPFQSDPEILFPVTQTGTHYILAYGGSVSGAPTFELVAEVVPFSLLSIGPGKVGNTGPVTLRVRGALLSEDAQFALVSGSGQVIPARQLFVQDSVTAFPTFDLAGALPGSYTLRATRNGETAVLETPVNVIAGIGFDVLALGEGPSVILQNRVYRFDLRYGNDGDRDVMAPLLLLESSTGTPLGFAANSLAGGPPLQVLGTSAEGPLDILRPRRDQHGVDLLPQRLDRPGSRRADPQRRPHQHRPDRRGAVEPDSTVRAARGAKRRTMGGVLGQYSDPSPAHLGRVRPLPEPTGRDALGTRSAAARRPPVIRHVARRVPRVPAFVVPRGPTASSGNGRVAAGSGHRRLPRRWRRPPSGQHGGERPVWRLPVAVPEPGRLRTGAAGGELRHGSGRLHRSGAPDVRGDRRGGPGGAGNLRGRGAGRAAASQRRQAVLRGGRQRRAAHGLDARRVHLACLFRRRLDRGRPDPRRLRHQCPDPSRPQPAR